MLGIHFCILLPKSNWSLLLSYSPAGLSVPARGLVDERTALSQEDLMVATITAMIFIPGLRLPPSPRTPRWRCGGCYRSLGSLDLWNRSRNQVTFTGIIWFNDWGILWLIAFYNYFPNSHSQVPLSILFFDLILWLGWLDFMTIFLQIWGENAIFLVFNYSCLGQFQLIMLAMLSKICQTRENLQFQLMMLAKTKIRIL